MAEFRILGTVEAYGPDGQVDAGPPRQRTVLAALLVDAGQVVPVSTLVDRVWGDAPPESARRSLHSHIARLRRLVDGLSTVREPVGLVRQADGYQLRVPPEQVDALRFRALVERARDQPDDEQADLLRAALDLWRGEPLAGTSGDWAARQRERLAQQRVDAAVGWARAELRRGNAATLTGPLGELVAAHRWPSRWPPATCSPCTPRAGRRTGYGTTRRYAARWPAPWVSTRRRSCARCTARSCAATSAGGPYRPCCRRTCPPSPAAARSWPGWTGSPTSRARSRSPR